ncbi:MAG: hypothetical protein LAT57_06965 [Balneolales bacterium]|nr:hypothetical protein [Balneolales bacterium]
MTPDQNSIIALVAIVGGLGVTTFIFYGIFSLIRYAIDSRRRNTLLDNANIVTKKEFAEFKVRVEKRLQNIEAITTEIDLDENDKNLQRLKSQPDEEDTSFDNSATLPNRLRTK